MRSIIQMPPEVISGDVQLHAGDDARNTKKVWHTGMDHQSGKQRYWCGHWYYRTPEELMAECASTIQDLLIHHPQLAKSEHYLTLADCVSKNGELE